MQHTLKISPMYFDAVERGDKTFEIRDDTDRGFQRGDVVELLEYDAGRTVISDEFRFTGRKLLMEITYISTYEQKPGMVVFAMRGVECTCPARDMSFGRCCKVRRELEHE